VKDERLTLLCGLAVDGKENGPRSGHQELPKPRAEGTGVNVSFSHCFKPSLGEKAQKVSVLVFQAGEVAADVILLGQVDISVSSLEAGREEIKTQPLRNRNKKYILGAELVFGICYSRKFNVTGPTAVTRVSQTDKDRGASPPGTGTERCQPRSATLGSTPPSTPASPKMPRPKKTLTKSTSQYLDTKKRNKLKFLSKKNSSASRKNTGPSRGLPSNLRDATEVPDVVNQCVAFLKHPECLKVQGIFRVSAPHADVASLRRSFEDGARILWERADQYGEDHGCHAVAGLLLQFLMQLDEPVIPFDIYDGLLAAEEQVPTVEAKVKFVKQLIDTIPPIHYQTLAALAELMHLIAETPGNKMTEDNLGIVFGPVLLRKKIETAQSMVADAPTVIKVTSTLVLQYAYIFLAKDMKKGSAGAGGAEAEGKREESALKADTPPDYAAPPPPVPAPRKTSSIPPSVVPRESKPRPKALKIPALSKSPGLLDPEASTPRRKEVSNEKFMSLHSMLVGAVNKLLESMSIIQHELESNNMSPRQIYNAGRMVAAFIAIMKKGSQRNPVEVYFGGDEPSDADLGAKISVLRETLRLGSMKVQNDLSQMEKQLKHQILLLEQAKALDVAVRLGQVLRDMGKVLDHFAPKSLNEEAMGGTPSAREPVTASAAGKGQADDSKQGQQLARLRRALQAAISSVMLSRLVSLRTEMSSCTTLREAVNIANVVRAVEKALDAGDKLYLERDANSTEEDTGLNDSLDVLCGTPEASPRPVAPGGNEEEPLRVRKSQTRSARTRSRSFSGTPVAAMVDEVVEPITPRGKIPRGQAAKGSHRRSREKCVGRSPGRSRSPVRDSGKRTAVARMPDLPRGEEPRKGSNPRSSPRNGGTPVNSAGPLAGPPLKQVTPPPLPQADANAGQCAGGRRRDQPQLRASTLRANIPPPLISAHSGDIEESEKLKTLKDIVSFGFDEVERHLQKMQAELEEESKVGLIQSANLLRSIAHHIDAFLEAYGDRATQVSAVKDSLAGGLPPPRTPADTESSGPKQGGAAGGSQTDAMRHSVGNTRASGNYGGMGGRQTGAAGDQGDLAKDTAGKAQTTLTEINDMYMDLQSTSQKEVIVYLVRISNLIDQVLKGQFSSADDLKLLDQDVQATLSTIRAYSIRSEGLATLAGCKAQMNKYIGGGGRMARSSRKLQPIDRIASNVHILYEKYVLFRSALPVVE